MKLSTNSYLPKEAISVIGARLKDVDGVKELLRVLKSGQVGAWIFLKSNGNKLQISPETWRVPDRPPSEFIYDFEKGHAFFDQDDPVSGDFLGGELHINREQLDVIIAEAEERENSGHKTQPPKSMVADWFKEDILPLGCATKEEVHKRAKKRFPKISVRFFNKAVWTDLAPEDWKKPGPKAKKIQNTRVKNRHKKGAESI